MYWARGFPYVTNEPDNFIELHLMSNIGSKAYRDMPIKKSLLNEIDLVLEQNNRLAASGKKSVRPKTRENRSTDVLKFFSILVNNLNFRIDSIKSLQQKHLQQVFKYLNEKGEKRTTILNMLASMRTFCNWIGKVGMVKEMNHYLEPTLSSDDGSIAEPTFNVDPIKILLAINLINDGKEARVALWLEQFWAFGLTMRASIMLRPHVDVNGKLIFTREVNRGGSRMHIVHISNDVQRVVAEKAKLFADRKTGKIGRPRKNVETDLQHFYYVLRRVGIPKKIMNETPTTSLQGKYYEQMHKILSESASQVN